ncbi:unnamed protein product [Soboliphyme baturini]|uniref:Transposase n=1 Tax=Soboliphyme baturini TaxID=241478 RepID=A0A183IIU9_9BILA|nr:unnamed protein product [Soboliphyme baturini]
MGVSRAAYIWSMGMRDGEMRWPGRTSTASRAACTRDPARRITATTGHPVRRDPADGLSNGNDPDEQPQPAVGSRQAAQPLI